MLAHSILWWVHIYGRMHSVRSSYKRALNLEVFDLQTDRQFSKAFSCTMHFISIRTYFNSIKSYIGTIWFVRDDIMSIQFRHKSSYNQKNTRAFLTAIQFNTPKKKTSNQLWMKIRVALTARLQSNCLRR